MSAVRERNILDLAPLLSFDTLRIQAVAHLDETACNRELTAREERRKASLLSRAAEYAERHDLKVYHQSDPRGWPLYVFKPEDLGDQDIWCLYSTIGVGVCPH